jgi:hypothetical protein
MSGLGSTAVNRPIDADSRRNPQKKFSGDFPFKIKGVTF